MREEFVFTKNYFNLLQRIALRLLKVICVTPFRFVYGLKFLGFEDCTVEKALEIIQGFTYEDSKMIVGELVGEPMVFNSHKSKTLRRLATDKTGSQEVGGV